MIQGIRQQKMLNLQENTKIPDLSPKSAVAIFKLSAGHDCLAESAFFPHLV